MIMRSAGLLRTRRQARTGQGDPNAANGVGDTTCTEDPALIDKGLAALGLVEKQRLIDRLWSPDGDSIAYIRSILSGGLTNSDTDPFVAIVDLDGNVTLTGQRGTPLDWK